MNMSSNNNNNNNTEATPPQSANINKKVVRFEQYATNYVLPKKRRNLTTKQQNDLWWNSSEILAFQKECNTELCKLYQKYGGSEGDDNLSMLQEMIEFHGLTYYNNNFVPSCGDGSESQASGKDRSMIMKKTLLHKPSSSTAVTAATIASNRVKLRKYFIKSTIEKHNKKQPKVDACNGCSKDAYLEKYMQQSTNRAIRNADACRVYIENYYLYQQKQHKQKQQHQHNKEHHHKVQGNALRFDESDTDDSVTTYTTTTSTVDIIDIMDSTPEKQSTTIQRNKKQKNKKKKKKKSIKASSDQKKKEKKTHNGLWSFATKLLLNKKQK